MAGSDGSIIGISHGRFDFAHILRGLAALSVVISHFVGVFWAVNPGIMDHIGLPRIASLPPLDPIMSVVVDYRLVFGQFGVGVFFVLSGFVISLAIEREDRRTFLIRRLMRVYPAYIVGFLLVMAGLWLAASLTGQPFQYSMSHILAHTLILVRGIVGYLRIDGISWTLEVELVFYAIMLVYGRDILKNGLAGVTRSVLFILGISLTMIVFRIKGFVAMQISCGLMLASGLVYALHVSKRIDDRQLIQTQAILAGLLFFVWLAIKFRLQMPLQWLAGYLLGMAAFAGCYWWYRDRRIGSRVLHHLADISYPLYVVHGLLGYAVMYWVVVQTPSPYLAIAGASFAMYLVALALHLMIEQPFIRWSRRLTAGVSKMPSLQVAG
ncbi:MAG: acyltransferase [Hyphomicrobiaceae bacterium]|nr:acyltransferase [Hyphomicrobiaceae bacterium]